MLEFLFGNIGAKIKLLGKIQCFIGFASAILSFIGAVILGIKLKEIWIAFVAIPAVAVIALLAWVGSFYTVGYGQLVESTESTDRKLDSIIKAHGERD